MPRDALLAELRSLLPADRILTDPDELFVYESDGFTIAKARPLAVLFPLTTEDVQSIVRLLVKYDTQIVPRGTGTGLAGGCVAFENGVVVSTVRMNKVLRVDLENRVAHVQAGVRNTSLSDAVALMPLQIDLPGNDDFPALTSPAKDPVDSRAGEPANASPNRKS